MYKSSQLRILCLRCIEESKLRSYLTISYRKNPVIIRWHRLKSVAQLHISYCLDKVFTHSHKESDKVVFSSVFFFLISILICSKLSLTERWTTLSYIYIYLYTFKKKVKKLEWPLWRFFFITARFYSAFHFVKGLKHFWYIEVRKNFHLCSFTDHMQYIYVHT